MSFVRTRSKPTAHRRDKACRPDEPGHSISGDLGGLGASTREMTVNILHTGTPGSRHEEVHQGAWWCVVAMSAERDPRARNLATSTGVRGALDGAGAR